LSSGRARVVMAVMKLRDAFTRSIARYRYNKARYLVPSVPILPFYVL
jgi:hypothetical protein